jgi:hypothetical protein
MVTPNLGKLVSLTATGRATLAGFVCTALLAYAVLMPITARAADPVPACTFTMDTLASLPFPRSNIRGFVGPGPGDITLVNPVGERCKGDDVIKWQGGYSRSRHHSCENRGWDLPNQLADMFTAAEKALGPECGFEQPTTPTHYPVGSIRVTVTRNK